MSTNPHDEENRPGDGGPYDYTSPQGASHHDWRSEPPGGTPSEWRPMPGSYDYAVPRRKTLPTVLAVLLLMAAVGVGIYFWIMRQSVQGDLQIMRENGRAFVEDFIEDLKNERLFAAYGKTTASYRQRNTQAQFDEYVRKHREVLKTDFKSHEFEVPPTALVAFGKKVTGVYRAPDPNLRTKPAGTAKLAVSIVREEGELKVDDVTITP